jgi:hypothetical protein
MKTKSTEYKTFDNLMGKLLKVPHGDVKDKLEAEKGRKKRKPKRPSSASRVSGGDD